MHNSKKTVQKQAQNTSELEEVKQLKDQILDDTTTFPFKGKLWIAIAANTAKLFGTNEIKFQIKIKDNRLIIESPEISLSGSHDNIQSPEAVNVT